MSVPVSGFCGPTAIAGTVRIIIIFHRFNNGNSLTAFTQDLNEDDVPTLGGGKWVSGDDALTLTIGFYVGLIQYDGDEVVKEKGEYEEIISAQTYEDAQCRLLSLKPGPAPA